MPKDRRDSKNAELQYKLMKSIEKVIDRYSNKYGENRVYYFNFIEFIETVRFCMADRKFIAFHDHIENLSIKKRDNLFKKKRLSLEKWYEEEMKSYKEAALVSQQRDERLAVLAKPEWKKQS